MADQTLQASFDQAFQHLQAGRLEAAEQLYRQVLAQKPDHADSLHHLGLIAIQKGQGQVAIDLIRRALAVNPDFPEARYNLGLALGANAQLDDSIAEFRRAIALKPNFPEALNNLGNALREKGQFDEAVATFRQAIAHRPNYPEAFSNLGNALKDQGKLDESIAAYRQAIILRPNYPEGYSNLGNALREKEQLDEAIAVYRQAIALDPNLAEPHNNLGIALKQRGRLDEAIAAYRQSIALRPTYAKAHGNLGNALRDKGRLDDAIDEYRQAISLDPNFPEARLNLGNSLKEKGQLDQAIAAYQEAIAHRPNYGEAFSNLGNALKDKGELDEAIAAYRQATALDPKLTESHSNIIFTMHYHPGYDARAIAEELRRWNHEHAEPLRKFIQPHSNSRDPDRRLRIGYVSPDFGDHPVGRNLMPWFHLHDRQQFDIICYAHVLRPDSLTGHFQQHANAWYNIVGLSDDQVAKQIRQDRIDILVDLALHTAGNRLLVFAYKPAPVQASYLGYAGSTGLQTIDYRISDPYIDPPGADESSYSEKTIRFPRTYWCYQPGVDPALAPEPTPALKAGFVTFGCQNNYCKISPAAWNAWISILRGQPNSKLLVYTGHGSHRDAARKNLADAGIDPNRLLFSDSRGKEYFQRYNEIDIALDPFPFCGGTTTCDALWMGVPVVTLSGETAVGRGGRSILSNLGLPELIASSPDQYVRIALDMAGDLDRLNSLRLGIRSRLQDSPLMDAEQFVRDLEAVYRRMWRAWCQASLASE